VPLPLFWYSVLPFWRRSEILAAAYLRSLGYRLIASGYRVRDGEVDLIAKEGDILVFIEVKSRRSSDPPEDAVNLRKKQRIIRAARAYMARHKLHEVPFRFDVVGVNSVAGRKPEFRLLRDAFRCRGFR
jgi:putative endonuclease